MQRERDYSISCCRLIALCLVIACHMMQQDAFAIDVFGGHIELAWWFNVGVQIFLLLSGYLYSGKDDIDPVPFYKKVFPKILVDYYIFIVIILFVMCDLLSIEIGADRIVGLFTLSDTAPGLGHVWFVGTIMFCYLLTPVLFKVIDALDSRGDLRFWVESIVLLVVIHIAVKHIFTAFTPAWINCFVIGMMYRRIERRGGRSKTLFTVIVIALCAIAVPLQFRIDYWPHEPLTDFGAWAYAEFSSYGHVLLAIVLVIAIRAAFNGLLRRSESKGATGVEGKPRWRTVLDWSDKYSYDIYLTHHVFVRSSFAVVVFIGNRLIALPLAVALSIVSALALYGVSQLVRKAWRVAKHGKRDIDLG